MSEVEVVKEIVKYMNLRGKQGPKDLKEKKYYNLIKKDVSISYDEYLEILENNLIDENKRVSVRDKYFVKTKDGKIILFKTNEEEIRDYLCYIINKNPYITSSEAIKLFKETYDNYTLVDVMIQENLRSSQEIVDQTVRNILVSNYKNTKNKELFIRVGDNPYRFTVTYEGFQRATIEKDKIEKLLKSKDKNTIRTVSDYLKAIEKIMDKFNFEKGYILFRGENKIFPNSCTPNIFRSGKLSSNKKFEIGLFDAMRQEKITVESNYLENAIDAQHGEFPSRLLDVSYNSLVALYFAVTPYYKDKEDFNDDVDGAVYLINIEDIFSPSASNTREVYDLIINHQNKVFSDCVLFERNHKFIDGNKQNNRIIAQQGAFILFQGNDTSGLPRYMKDQFITIPAKYKKVLRNQLKKLFGIHTGYIYPETVNLVESVSEKGARINTNAFSIENEIKYSLYSLENEIKYYIKESKTQNKESSEEQIINRQILFEQLIYNYRIGLFEVGKLKKEIGENYIKEISYFFEEFNKILKKYESRIDIKDLFNVFRIKKNEVCGGGQKNDIL